MGAEGETECKEGEAVRVWRGKVCGIITLVESPGCGEPLPDLGECDDCVLCDSPCDRACIAYVVEMDESEIERAGGLS